MKQVFITGATGFVGVKLVRTLLESGAAILHLLVRESEGDSPEDRVKNLLGKYYSPEQSQEYLRRIRVIKGDICAENLGMSGADWNRLAQKIDTIFHSAANINFGLPYEKAREINLDGTKRILAFAAKCRENKVLQRLNHLSTAYVAGKSKRFRETDFAIGQEFSNTYEQTKLEAELEVLKASEMGLPAMIFRPSIISGKKGEAAKSGILFIFRQCLLRGNNKDFICNDDSELNIVPVDYVVEAMLHISKAEANLGKAFNLTCRQNVNVKQMIIDSCRLLNLELPAFYSIANKENASKFTRLALSMFLDYLDICHTFDDSLAQEALRGSGIECVARE